MIKGSFKSWFSRIPSAWAATRHRVKEWISSWCRNVRTKVQSRWDDISVISVIVATIISLGVANISQLMVICRADALSELLDVFFNIFTIVFSLAFSATFLISYKDIEDKTIRKEFHKLLRLRQILMLLMLISMAISYLAIKHSASDSLNLSIAIAVFVAAIVGCFITILQICKSVQDKE